MASEEFSYHGCNDFKLSNFFTQEECINFDKEYHEWNGDPKEHDPDLAKRGWASDSMLMSYYSDKLKKETK